MKKFLTLLFITSLLSSLHGQVNVCVNMNDFTGTFTEVSVFGGFNEFDASANPLSDPEGDGIFCASINISVDPDGNGDEYLFVVDGEIESFPVDAPCTVTFFGEFETFTNRLYTGGSEACFNFNSCTASPCAIVDTATTGATGATGATATTGAAAAIPTMSEWGLMIFLLLVMNLSLVFLRRLELVRLN